MKFEKCIGGNDSSRLYLDKTKQNKTPKQNIMATFPKAGRFLTDNAGWVEALTAEEAAGCPP